MSYQEYASFIENDNFTGMKELLDANKIPRLNFRYGNLEKSYDAIFRDFFEIAQKNKTNNLINIFYDQDIKKEVNTNFPLEQLFDIYELANDSDGKDKKIELLIKYAKEKSYPAEMIEPLKIALDSHYLDIIQLQKKNSMDIEINTFSSEHKELEIIIPGQAFKNPIYGLIHYINVNKFLFQYKTIAVDEITKKSLNNYKCHSYIDFFKNIAFEDFEYSLFIKDKDNDLKKISLSFYESINTEDDENGVGKKILSFENFEREFLISFITRGNFIEKLIKQIQLLNNKLKITCLDDNTINISFNGSEIVIENNRSLFFDILNYVYVTNNLGIIDIFFGMINFSNYRYQVVSTRSFYNSERDKKNTIYHLKKLI